MIHFVRKIQDGLLLENKFNIKSKKSKKQNKTLNNADHKKCFINLWYEFIWLPILIK